MDNNEKDVERGEVEDFVRVANVFRGFISEPGAWVHFLIFYGGAFVIGNVGARIAFVFGQTVGFIVCGGALLYIWQLVDQSGGVIVPLVLPQAWVAWGVISVAGSSNRILKG